MTKQAKPRKRKRIRRILLSLFILLLLAAVGWFAYNMLKAEYTITYDSYTATTGSISNALSFSGNLSLEFVDFRFCTDEAKYTIEECKERDVNYAAPLRVEVRLTNRETGEVTALWRAGDRIRRDGQLNGVNGVTDLGVLMHRKRQIGV